MTKIKAKKAVEAQPASSTKPVENLGSFNLCKLIKLLNRKKFFALKWLQDVGLLNRETTCDNCGRPMILVHRESCIGSRVDQYEWECNKCRMCKKPLRNGTIFQCSKMSLQKITLLLYFWAHDFPAHIAERELSVTKRTVNKWYLLCQEACIDALIRNTCKLGGEGRNLEVVEGYIGTRAMDSSKTPPEQPVIGVIDVDTCSCFLQLVIGNPKSALLKLLKERIANGSTLYSKCWTVRGCINDEKFCKVVKKKKLTLINEDRSIFQKLNAKICKSGDKVDTLVHFDSLLCATVYKNAMKNEEFFFVKFLGDLGTMYRDGIRNEMTTQLEPCDSEPGSSIQRRTTERIAENTELTSTVGHSVGCRSKEHSNSKVEATRPDKTICEDADEARNGTVSKRNVCNLGHNSEENSGTVNEIIEGDDTCKSHNGIESEQTVLLLEDGRRVKIRTYNKVIEGQHFNSATEAIESARSTNTAGHVSDTECAESNEVSELENHGKLPNSSAGEEYTETSRLSPASESCATNGVVSQDGDSEMRSRRQVELVVCVTRNHEVVYIEANEVMEDSTYLDAQDDKQSHVDEIDISMEEPVDMVKKGDEKETVEASVQERDVNVCKQKEVRGDVCVVDDRDSEKAALVTHAEDPVDVVEKGDEKETVETGVQERDVNVCKQKEVRGDVCVVDDRDSEKAALVTHAEDPVDVVKKGDEKETVETGVQERDVNVCKQKEVRGDVRVVDDGGSEKAALVTHAEDPDITIYDQKDMQKDADVTAEKRSRDVSKVVNSDSMDDNTSEAKLFAAKLIVSGKSYKGVVTDVKIDDVEDVANGCTAKDIKTVVSPDRNRDEDTGLININEAEGNANQCTVKEGKTNVTPSGKRDAGSDLVNIDGAEDSTDESPVKSSKTSATLGGKRNAEDSADESTAKCSKTSATPSGRSSPENSANKSTAKGSETSTTPDGKMGAESDVVNIDGGEESTIKPSKINCAGARKGEAASEVVNIENVEDEHIKHGETDKTASGKKDTTCDLVHIDYTEDNTNECTAKHGTATVGKKRASTSDPVNIDDAEDCTVKRSKLSTNAEGKGDTCPDLINLDDNEDNENQQEGVLSKINETAKRHDTASEVVNIDDLEDNSNELKGMPSKTDGTARRESDVVSDVVNIDDVEDNTEEHKGRQESVNQALQEECAIFSVVIDVDEGDSDIEVIEAEVLKVPDIMVVGEQKGKAFQKEERRHERRLLVDDVPCSLSKSVLKTYFEKFGKIEYIKILPIPSRRSLRYAVLEFRTKEIVDTIQAARPHVLENGVKFVTFRGSSPDIDSSLNTRLKERVIVKVQKNDKKLTTGDVQQYFSEYGRIYLAEQVSLTGMEAGSSTFVVSFEDYDSADVACINSPHTIKGVENVTCEKVEDDDLLLSGTEMDPICIENDSDLEEVQVDDLKRELYSSGQSQQGRSLDQPSTSGTQFGGKRPSDGVADGTHKKFRSYNTSERNFGLSQSMIMSDLTQITNKVMELKTAASRSGYSDLSDIDTWFGAVVRPAQSTTPAPSANVAVCPAPAIWRDGNFRKRQVETRPPVQVRLQSQAQAQPQQAQSESRVMHWQLARRPTPSHFQPRRTQPWPPAKREPISLPRHAVPYRTLTGIPITSGSFAGPSHVTRTRPGHPPPSSTNARSFIPRASGSQGPRF